MKVLVTGANGMLGQDLCPILEDIGCFVIPTDYDTLDITDKEAVDNAITSSHPDLIIHCAAYTNVDKAESDIDGARQLNVYGTENVARAAGKIGATMVYISTDYVFDGDKKGSGADGAYLPSDVPNPENVYGLTKFEGENAVKKYCEKYYIARTAWLYGLNGRNFVETMLALAGANNSTAQALAGADKKELKVVDDQVGSPTWTVDLVQGILKILNKPYGVYHLSGAGKTSWYGFAKEIFKLSGLDVNLKPCTTEEFPRPAKRPHYSVIENTEETGELLRPWQEALGDYLKLRNNKEA